LATNKNVIGANCTKIENYTKNVPTCFELNGLTKPYQTIVNTYGIPRYKEINPAFFTVITFSYQFGVMFGDVGHGLALLFFAIYMCKSADKFDKGLLREVFAFRYMLVLMGFFATYCGLIYNDFISIKVLALSSCYHTDKLETINGASVYDIYERKPDCTYQLGFDWIWGMAENEIAYMNSYKMKLSIIIGVLHMTVGILLKGLNTIYFGEVINFIFEFIPQLLFMSCTFGYMCFCIVIKWLTDWSTRQPPAIINIFIEFVQLQEYPLYGDEAGQTQLKVQKLLATIA